MTLEQYMRNSIAGFIDTFAFLIFSTMNNKYFSFLIAKITLLLIYFYFTLSNCYAQKSASIFYKHFENGSLIPNRETVVKCNTSRAIIENIGSEDINIIDFSANRAIKTSVFNGQKYAVIYPFEAMIVGELNPQLDTILGYACKKASYTVFSNRIEVWYTEDFKFRACPSISVAPPNGLVLKYVINGNRIIQAVDIKYLKSDLASLDTNYKIIDDAIYAEIQIKSRYKTISVFDKEQINYSNIIIPELPLAQNKICRLAKGNIILKKIKLPENYNKSVCFVQLTEWSNGDAYDRVGSVFMMSGKGDSTIINAIQNGLSDLPIYKSKEDKEYQGIIAASNYTPPIELMRFFTPFGVGFYNTKRTINGYNWNDSVVYKQEVTSLIPSDESEIWIGVYIGNYDKGGHKVSLNLNFYPEMEMPEKKNWIYPLFSTVNIMESIGQNYGSLFLTDTLLMQFDIPDSVQNIKLLFTTTGHGGWENGDEFNAKVNQIFIDGKKVFEISPWRSDCGTYRTLNPASGNFPDGLSSSDLSRSNWCPGTLTPPFVIPLKKLGKGMHEIEVVIDQGKPEGGSFSHWCVTGILVGDKE